MQTDILASTDGKGKHSDEARMVRITELKVAGLSTLYFPEDPVTGQLRAYFVPDGFNPLEWNVRGHGLICTDRKWIREFKQGLRTLGFTIRAVNNLKYSDAETQGDNYVCLDFGPEFYKGWQKISSKVAEKVA